MQLTPLSDAEFNGSSLPSDWDANVTDTGGSATVSGGSLRVDGALAGTADTYDPGQVVEFTATFAKVKNQNAGFGVNLDNYPFAVFTTTAGYTPTSLYAWTGDENGNERTTELPNVDPTVPHRFKIAWGVSSATYWVDGVQVAQHALSAAGPTRPVVADGLATGGSLKLHWLRVTPYTTPGTFTSRVLDSATCRCAVDGAHRGQGHAVGDRDHLPDPHG